MALSDSTSKQMGLLSPQKLVGSLKMALLLLSFLLFTSCPRSLEASLFLSVLKLFKCP